MEPREILTFLIWITLTCLNGCAHAQFVPRALFLNALLEDYDNTVTPTFDKPYPTVVNVSLYINNIDAVNEQTMDFTVNLFVTQTWHDYRLEFHDLIDATYLELDSKLIKSFWVPDLFFVNEKSSYVHDVTVPNTLLHLYMDGTVVYKMRISLTATCFMELHSFPMDVQNCSLLMKSFGYTNNSLQFQWSASDPLTRQAKLEMSQFSLVNLQHRNCDGMGQNNDSFTCLAVDLKLHRSVGFYMIQLYIPSALIVVLSWVSFCLDVGAVPARISLGILTVLTMTNMKTIAVSSLPKVSYIKAIDVWMAACLAFVFSSLLEFAIVNAFARRLVPTSVSWDVMVESEPLTVSHRDDDHKGWQEETDKSKTNGTARPDIVNSMSAISPNWTPDPHGLTRANQIDKVSMFLFPLGFLAFIAIYVITYRQ